MTIDFGINDLKCCGNCKNLRCNLFCDLDMAPKRSWYSCEDWKFDGFNFMGRKVV